MSNLKRWWDGRYDGEKLVLRIVGGLAVVATGGALAYTIRSTWLDSPARVRRLWSY